jgi:Rps23 Pro-64 3,4-dihydroxylase Tpa1-like proline 4-hydroxylase
MEVTLEKNVFSPSELNYIFKSIFQKENECKWSIQKHSWEDAIQNKSLGVVSLFRISGDLHDMIASTLKKYLKPEEVIKSVQYYEWNQLSQISWHNDDGKKGAITVYLNDRWDPDWGGFFCWQDNSENMHLHVPQFNSAIVVRGNPHHHVSLINPYAPVRKTLQIWLDDAQPPHALPSPP